MWSLSSLVFSDGSWYVVWPKILDSDILVPYSLRKQTLRTQSKLAKSTQVFPKCYELTNVQCDFSQAINSGGFGIVYQGIFQNRRVCIKAVRLYQIQDNTLTLRVRAFFAHERRKTDFVAGTCRGDCSFCSPVTSKHPSFLWHLHVR